MDSDFEKAHFERTHFERAHFAILARYNGQANRELFDLLAALPPEEFTADHKSYFHSLKGILNHLLTCDINWMRRFREVFGAASPLDHPRLEPAGHAWTIYKCDTLSELRRERETVDRLLSAFVERADYARFGERLRYSDSHGTAREYTFREVLDHVFNHQTHHRGQVSQILDELGVEHDYSNILGVLE